MKVQTWEYAKVSHNNCLSTCLQNMAYRGSRVLGYTQGPVIGHETLEDQNEKMESDLMDKISQLKPLCIQIGMEVKDQRMLQNDMDARFNSTSLIITNTVGKVGKLLKNQSNYHIHYLLLFCLFVFLVLWCYIR